jgi:hypothetical protein
MDTPTNASWLSAAVNRTALFDDDTVDELGQVWFGHSAFGMLAKQSPYEA